MQPLGGVESSLPSLKGLGGDMKNVSASGVWIQAAACLLLPLRRFDTLSVMGSMTVDLS